MICLFCGKDRPQSREHLWPQWARDLLDPADQELLVPHSIEPNGEPHTEWDSRIFSATIKGVCRPCNNGWMSELETKAKEHAAGLIRGVPQTIEPEPQAWIARWAYLKILLLEQVDKRQRMLSEQLYRSVFEAREMEKLRGIHVLPSSVAINIAAYGGPRWGRYQHTGLGDKRTGEIQIFIGTLTIGRLVIQVIQNLLGPHSIDLGRPRLVRRRYASIWPAFQPLRWPPGRPMDDRELRVFEGPQVK